jgi:hypothetical protein
MVLVFSSRSNHSPHVRREVERAVSRGIPILPIRIEDVPLSASLEYFIGTVHWLDALTPPLEKHLRHLAETMRLLLSRAGKPERAGVEAEAPTPAPTAETTVDKVPHRPTPVQDAYEAPKRWGRRTGVRLAAGLAAVVGLVIAVAIFVPPRLPSDDSSGSAIFSSTPEGSSSTVTPVPPTTEGPELRTYTGTTSQGRPLEFDVVDGSQAISRIEFDVEGICSGAGCACEVQRETTLGRPVPIVDNTFSYGEDDFDIIGTFDSITTASGHLNVHTSGIPGTFPPPCNRNSVTWTASAQ